VKNMLLTLAIAGLSLVPAAARAAETENGAGATPVAVTATATATATEAATEAAVAAASEIETDKFEMDVRGRMQWFAVVERLNDPFRNDDRVYLFMKQARLRFSGHYEEIEYDVNTAYGGEETTASAGVALGLLDFSFDAPLP
jgi:hypothetical protein